MSTQQNDIDNENLSVSVANNFAINQDEFNRNVQAKDEQIDNKLFILLYCDLMSDDCNSGARSYDDVIVSWICLTLAQWQYTFNITDNSLESLIKLQSFLMHRLFHLIKALLENILFATNVIPNMILINVQKNTGGRINLQNALLSNFPNTIKNIKEQSSIDNF